MRRLLTTAIAALLLGAFDPAAATAQGVLLHLGYHDNSDPGGHWWEQQGVEHDLSYGGVYGGRVVFGRKLSGDARGVFSLEFFYHAATIEPTDAAQIEFWNLEEIKYTLKTFAVDYERRLWKSESGASLWLGLGVGFTKWANDPVEGVEQCSELGCDPEPFRLTCLPGVAMVFGATDKVGIQADLRYWIIAGGDDSIFPFSSGFLVQGGILIEPGAANGTKRKG